MFQPQGSGKGCPGTGADPGDTEEEKLSQGPKAWVGNRRFRRYLKVEKDTVKIDPREVAKDARYDGK